MKNQILSLLGASAMLGACSGNTSEGKTEKTAMNATPNVVFIIADDMGYADLGCYGNPHIQTPNINRLAAEGVRFTQAYAGSAVSSPSRCALMTGKHTGHTRIRNNFVEAGGIEGTKGAQKIRRQGLTPQDTTMATVFKQKGYISGLINKWHMDGFDSNAGPLDNGFDEFKGWLVSTGKSNSPYYYPEYRFDNRELVKIKENENGQKNLHNNDISTDQAIEFIDRHQKDPFFLYLAYDTPHEPYVIVDTKQYDGFDWDDTSKLYASLITNMDRNIGRVLDHLDSLRLTDNSIIVFVSDNGGATMAPHASLATNGVLRGNKGNFYEGGIRVPVIIKTPFTKGGVTSSEPIFFPDFMPTLSELTGTVPPKDIDGVSLVPILRGEQENLSERTLFWEFPSDSYAVRRGPWKLIHKVKTNATELYNIDRDIRETTDLAAVHPDIVAELQAYHDQASAPSQNFPSFYAKK